MMKGFVQRDKCFIVIAPFPLDAGQIKVELNQLSVIAAEISVLTDEIEDGNGLFLFSKVSVKRYENGNCLCDSGSVRCSLHESFTDFYRL